MKNLTIKAKLFIIAVLAVVGMAVLIASQFSGLHKMEDAAELQILIGDIKATMLTLRRNEKDFLARKDLKYREKFLGNHEHIIHSNNDLIARMEYNDFDSTAAQQLLTVLQAYKEKFLKLVAAQQEIGLHHKDGKYGSLRKAVHEAEELLNNTGQDHLVKDTLMLRRREKDFMLRNDLKYVGKFDKDMAVLRADLNQTSLDPAYLQKIMAAVTTYEKDFKALVATRKKLGLNNKSGVLGEMRRTIHESEDSLKQLFDITSQDALQVKNNAKAEAIIISIIIILVIVAVIMQIARRINRAINALATLMDRACREDDLSLRADDSGTDEISTIAAAFNDIMEKFNTAISSVSSSVSVVSTNGAKQALLVESITQGVQRQHGELDQVSTAMNEMSATVQEVAQNTNLASAAASTAMDQAGEGQTVVGNAITAMETLRSRVETAVGVIGELEAKSSEISQVLEVISGISEQTNLLALNAAIEAARAGEQGRGFAVVADEVRALAARTKDSADEISVMISGLQGQVREAVTVMETSQDDTRSSANEAESAGNALTQIVAEIGAINDMTTHIATAAEEQSAVAEEINRNITTISAEASNTAESGQETLNATSEIGADMERLRESVSHFKLSAGEASRFQHETG